MLARDHAAEPQHLREELIEHPLRSLSHPRVPIIPVRHNVDVHVPVAGMTETRDWKCSFSKPFREFDQLDELASRHDDILVRFGQVARNELLNARLSAQNLSQSSSVVAT